MVCFAAVGDGRDFVVVLRSVWLLLSDSGVFYLRLVCIVGGCLRSILHSGFASSCPCSWVVVGYDLGICDRRFGDSAFWCGVISELSNAIASLRVRWIGRACYFRYCLRDDSGLRSLFGWFAPAL